MAPLDFRVVLKNKQALFPNFYNKRIYCKFLHEKKQNPKHFHNFTCVPNLITNARKNLRRFLRKN